MVTCPADLIYKKTLGTTRVVDVSQPVKLEIELLKIID
jgi:hypothetical protein